MKKFSSRPSAIRKGIQIGTADWSEYGPKIQMSTKTASPSRTRVGGLGSHSGAFHTP
jgi:hypothetical protein